MAQHLRKSVYFTMANLQPLGFGERESKEKKNGGATHQENTLGVAILQDCWRVPSLYASDHTVGQASLLCHLISICRWMCSLLTIWCRIGSLKTKYTFHKVLS